MDNECPSAVDTWTKVMGFFLKNVDKKRQMSHYNNVKYKLSWVSAVNHHKQPPNQDFT